MTSHHKHEATCTRSFLGLWIATLALETAVAQAPAPVAAEGPASRVTSRPHQDSAPTATSLPEPERRAVDSLRLELDQMMARLAKADGQLRPVPGAFRQSPKDTGSSRPAQEGSRPVEPIQNLKLEGKTRFVHIEETVAGPKPVQTQPPSLPPLERASPARVDAAPSNAGSSQGGNGIRVRGIQLEPDRPAKPNRTPRPKPTPGR